MLKLLQIYGLQNVVPILQEEIIINIKYVGLMETLIVFETTSEV